MYRCTWIIDKAVETRFMKGNQPIPATQSTGLHWYYLLIHPILLDARKARGADSEIINGTS